MDRDTRVLLALKQRKALIKGQGIPKVAELEEGVPQFRIIDEGLQQFIRVNNDLYSIPYTLHTTAVKDEISASENGYIKFGNGMIMQWGKQTATSATETVTFPLKFPNTCFNVVLTDYLSTDTGGVSDLSIIKTLPTQTQVEISCLIAMTAFFWQAIGN